jgi:cell volume regulation protein A
VWICLAAFGFTRHEIAFISWVGLRGAVSILLAILPVVAGIPDAGAMFNTAFIVVLASLLVQGWTIRPVARFLGMIVPARLGPVDRIELELPGRGDHEIVAYVVHPDSAVAKGHRIPRWARPSLIIRDGRALRPHRSGRPQAGDRIYVITTPEYVSLLDRLFAAQTPTADDPRLYGEFGLEPGTRLGDLARTYDIAIAPADEVLTVGELLRRELAGDIEQGDRISLVPLDIIVRRVGDDHSIEEVGLAMEHARRDKPPMPLFQTPRELGALIASWIGKRGKGTGAPGPDG